MPSENKIINIEGQKINYLLKRIRRIKYMRLAVRADATIVITAPKIYPLFLIQSYIQQEWEWIKTAVAKQKSCHGILSLAHNPREIAHYKKETQKLLQVRLKHFNEYYSLTWCRIAIRNQSSRWGSCSSKKNLNFNYRLCLLAPDLADCIIVHELCHLAEMNHSRRFWTLVARAVSDYKNKIKIIKNIS